MYSLLFRRLVTVAGSSPLQRPEQSFFILLNNKHCAYIACATAYIAQTGLVTGVRFSSGKGWHDTVTLENQWGCRRDVVGRDNVESIRNGLTDSSKPLDEVLNRLFPDAVFQTILIHEEVEILLLFGCCQSLQHQPEIIYLAPLNAKVDS
ncbi:hypothetical protein BH24CHL1_BH24CHL1_14490 [soil metagenome]